VILLIILLFTLVWFCDFRYSYRPHEVKIFACGFRFLGRMSYWLSLLFVLLMTLLVKELKFGVPWHNLTPHSNCKMTSGGLGMQQNTQSKCDHVLGECWRVDNSAITIVLSDYHSYVE